MKIKRHYPVSLSGHGSHLSIGRGQVVGLGACACFVLVLAALVTASAFAQQPRRVEFRRDIQPIFHDHCFKCHGPDKRDGGLRLTDQRSALTPADSDEVVIKPGNAAHSLLWQRISNDDESERMPPEEERSLTGQQIELVRIWIEQGAVWPSGEDQPRHWAYVAPVRPARPAVKARNWPVNGIDYFVLARQEKAGMVPAAPCDLARLIRRLSLALTGIPPAVEQVDAFVQDPSPDAYENLVDRLLASPRYGERWAQPWLDLARYADSNGFQADQLRESWAYRDWVIAAMNRDQPFDQFVVEQLAGDLLPNATVEQKIATGFHRTVTCNVEAGVHPEENRVNQVLDRVSTTGTVFLGTTLECCQCHNHKYDPFTQEEYYRLFACFNNTPLEVKQTSGVTYDFVGPKMALPLSPAQQSTRDGLQQQQQELERQRAEAVKSSGAQREKWQRDLADALREPPAWTVLEISSAKGTGGEEFQILDDHSVLVAGSLPGTSRYTITADTDLTGITAFKLETLTHESLPGKGPGRGDAKRPNFILSEFQVALHDGKTLHPVPLNGARADFAQSRFDAGQAIDGKRNTGWAIAPQFHKPHWVTFRTKQTIGGPAGTSLVFTLDQNYGRGRTIGRVRLSALVGSADAAETPPEIAAIVLKDAPTDKERQRLDKFYARSNPRLREIDTELQTVKRELDQLEPPTTLVMVEMDKPRQSHILIRGDYLNPGRSVTFGTPAALHPWDPALPKNRLGLARWLVKPENPLLARVTVNRWWMHLFGRALVTSPEDFGTRSDPPTHPALLDWLACELMESGWSRKHMLKLMVMSATFRQASGGDAEAWQRDPHNELYARGPRWRLPAEMIRDNGLAISGLLSTKMGGPPIMPYQPDGIWRAVGRNAPKWSAAKGEDRFRRGVYVVWRRAAPYPSFVSFDAPDRSSCVVRRPVTNTPLQALTLLNDPAFSEMALSLAYQMYAWQGKDASAAQKATCGFRRCVAHAPTSEDLAALTEFYKQQRQRLAGDPERAKSLLKGIAGYHPPAGVDQVELAAWFFVANVLLNLDETVTLD